MTLSATIRHNQCTFISIALGLIVAAGLFGCHLLKLDFESSAQKAAEIAAAAAPLAPAPYKEILIAISTLLSTGIFVDNRRKDAVIKVLKSNNANKTKRPTSS